MLPASHDSQKRGWLLLLLILGLALALRCVTLSRESLWLDEASSWWFSGNLSRALHAETNNPPLYYVLLYFWMRCFGTGEAAMRSLSVIPSIAAVWMVYRFSRDAFSPRIAYIAMAYQAISTFQIFYAQEARTYSLLISCVLGASLFLWRALYAGSARARWWNYAGYSVCLASAFYCHYVTAFFLAAHGLFVLFRRRQELFRMAAATTVALLLFAPWVIMPLRWLRTASTGTAGPPRRYVLLKFPQAFFSFLFGDSLIPLDEDAVRHVSQVLLQNWWILVLSLAAVAVIAAYGVKAWKRWGDPLVYVAFLGFGSVTIAFLASLRLGFFDERYLSPASPFLYIAFAAGVNEMLPESKLRSRAGWKFAATCSCVGVYLCLLCLSLYHYYFQPRYGKEQWREVAAYIEAAASPDREDLIVFDPDFFNLCYDYYQKRSVPYLRATPDVRKAFQSSPAEVDSRIAGFRRVWLVRSHSYSDGVLDALKGVLAERSRHTFPKQNGIEVIRLERVDL